MKELKEMLTESTVNEAKVNLSDNIKDFKTVIMPGQNEMGDFGVIIGKPFRCGDKAGRKAAEDLVKHIGLPTGNYFDDIIGDLEEGGYLLNEMLFCYFMTTGDTVTVDCYTFGGGGVYVIK